MINWNELSQEYIKCYSDKSRIYMITNYLKTYDGTQGKNVQFELFPRQKILCETLAKGVNVCTVKYRQAGISTVTGGFISCEICLAEAGTPKNVLIIGNTLDISQQMLKKIEEFLMQFPLWMWDKEVTEGLSDEELMEPPSNKNVIFKIANSKELRLKNGSRIVARSSGPDASRGVGGVKYLIFDEAAFIENGNDVYASAVPTVSSGGQIIVVSTPCGQDAFYFQTYRRAKLKGTKDWNNYELVDMKWYQDPRYGKHLEWTRKNEITGEYEVDKDPVIDAEGHVKYDEERWERLVNEGWKPRSPWYIKMCQQFNNDPQKIAQELDISFLGSDSTVVGPEYIEAQTKMNVKEPDPQYKDPILEDLWIWKPPFNGHRYIVSVDNSRGSSDDATAIEIIDMDGRDDEGKPIIEQVLEYNGKLTGDIVGEMVNKYGHIYNDAFVIVEDIGGYGSATLLQLINLKYPNLYYDDPAIKNFTSQNDATPMKETDKGLPGFHSSSVRFQMLSNFANLIKTNQFKIRSSRVINELHTWIFKNGRIDHKDGCHDDTLTCLAMGLFVMEFSINRQLKEKITDAAMLNATLIANTASKLPCNIMNSYGFSNSYTEKKYNGPMPVYTNKTSNNNNPYGQYMWLLK